MSSKSPNTCRIATIRRTRTTLMRRKYRSMFCLARVNSRCLTTRQLGEKHKKVPPNHLLSLLQYCAHFAQTTNRQKTKFLLEKLCVTQGKDHSPIHHKIHKPEEPDSSPVCKTMIVRQTNSKQHCKSQHTTTTIHSTTGMGKSIHL